MLVKDPDIKDLECELEPEEEAFIWKYTKDGKKKLDILGLANLLKRHYYFITIGYKNKEIYYYEEGIYKSGGYNFIKERIENYTRGNVSISQVNEVIGHIERSTYVKREFIENTPTNLICFKNCIYDIEKEEILPHSPKIIFTSRTPHNYNKDAKTNKIKEFLKDTLIEEDIPIIQEFLGYLLYRRYIFKKAIIFVGEPDTGKTTLLNLIVKFIGEENTSGESLHKITTDRFAAYSLYGKHLNFYDDLPFQDLKVTGQFKVVTGGGYVSAEKKFGDRFQFKNFAKLLYATNKISGVKDVDDEAYFGRWIIIFFNNIFDKDNPKTDKKLIDKITTKEEIEGLVIWALEGLKRLLELEQGNFSYYRTPEENKLIMERSSNTVSAFVQDCLEQSDDSIITKNDMYNAYSLYVNENGGAKVSKEKFGREIQIKCPYIINRRTGSDRKTCWGNIKLKISENSKKPDEKFLIKKVEKDDILEDLKNDVETETVF